MIKKIFTALLVFLTTACTQDVTPDDITISGKFNCYSPKENDISFHSDMVESYTFYGVSDPYVTININGSTVKLFESEGWVCTLPNGETQSLFQRS